MPQVTLFIGNLSKEWTDEARLRSDMGAHGRIERAAVMRNAQGVSKVVMLAMKSMLPLSVLTFLAAAHKEGFMPWSVLKCRGQLAPHY